ncbi:hypothetical protein P691DRAFT_785108 [Macrolepiota fuliginosa MF-IS2]|uniref:F-box domain-containing protein n=1 Tax=Macrolepiota fuliginosa MF-IS2 TaxID=1400762 RepID=A0A9P6C1H0_9AGAR|nr:hypothetical protein P691DRAFT_785108 [Macrolepiota fuliginosa MF-IS2]
MTMDQLQDLGTMQRRFALPKLIDLVCRRVRWNSVEVRGNTALLAALARTCRAWSDIALDNLWHTIFGISSLVRCMPQDLWCLERGVLTLRRPLIASDMHVLRKYASRVRVLDHKECPGSFVQAHASIYQVLMLFSNDCLLPRLEELCFCYPIDTVNGLSELIETVARNCHTDSLRNFKLFYPISSDVAFSTVLRPLLKFHELEHVDIGDFFATKLTNEEVAEIASSLPNIQSLSLPFRAKDIGPPFLDWDHSLPTLSILLALAKCTKLRNLSLEIDASDEAVRHILWKKLDKERIRNYSLRTLSVGWSPISHKEFVASFLSDVFPNLEDVDSSLAIGRDDERRYHRWQYIGRVLLPMFGWMREREYERMGGSAGSYNDTMEDEGGDWLDGGNWDRRSLTTGQDSF